MPTKRCQSDGKPGWKWGDGGKCYTYSPGNEASEKKAKQKAINQGIAIGDIDVNSSAFSRMSYSEKRDVLEEAIRGSSNTGRVWVADFYDDSVIYEIAPENGDYIIYEQPYEVSGSSVKLTGSPVEVKRVVVYVAKNSLISSKINEQIDEMSAVGKPMKRERIAQLRKAVSLLNSLLEEVDPIIEAKLILINDIEPELEVELC